MGKKRILKRTNTGQKNITKSKLVISSQISLEIKNLRTNFSVLRMLLASGV
jgi:hypothetical protein